ncbi:GPI ethanolamine phosphate transferase 1 [Aricia agestis]|uniref:GPI ethanolamine phosphate transferase 1 n=1 Tax=Aricia agestis TaxID=91739 RepID=UPI001C20403D|nr:GPI ethanolamine phosphate transferase 1 [Aricia agestis]
MFILGLVIHITFLFSIFDIYFKSPIVNDVVPYRPHHDAVSERLVLIVVDGLRAESFTNYTTMPYLRSIANSLGRWGISNTRVPTESRPGHVAIIAGFYEDPSAVAKGWKENPVDFDNLFNQSLYTWCWGAFDIVDIFTKGNIDNHIFVDKFDPYDQSFSSNKNTTLLDDWVFTRVKDLFDKSHADPGLYERLHKDKIIFFLHLLGTDTSGHTHKPKTADFLTTIKFVDENIKEIENKISTYFNNDGKTTFLVTSDHGMTDWGSHGTGDHHETQTPYVLWGAGVKQVTQDNIENDPENYLMSLTHRVDINQADLTPLMASFLSIPVPVNSIGKLVPGLLDMSLANKAKAIYSNSRQLLSQYNKKRLDVEANAISFLYQPYKPLDAAKVTEITEFTEKLLHKEEYENLISFSNEIAELSLKGLDYYHNYYQRPLLLTITLSFIGWILYLLRFILEQTLDFDDEKIINRSSRILERYIKSLLLLLSASSLTIICVQKLPLQYYIYFLLPLLLLWYALIPINIWVKTWKKMEHQENWFTLCIEAISYTSGSILLGMSFTHRWLLSIPLLGMGLWPFFSSYKHLLTKPLCFAWTMGCVFLSMFSFMPVVGKQVTIELVIAAGLLWCIPVCAGVYLLHNHTRSWESREILICGVQICLLLLCLYTINTQSTHFKDKLPISELLQTLCWIISAVIPILPLLYSKKILNRLLGINMSILMFYLLLSVSHEGLFMVTLILSVNCWMLIEFKLLDLEKVKIHQATFGTDNENEKSLTHIERSVSSHDFRRAFFFTLYIILAYFGTGNIASLNSFEVRWVICFTTSYKPFIITTLILSKTLAPFLSVACSFRGIQQLTKAPVGYLNMIVLIYSNIMGLHLLYHVKNVGSWLDIGMSISQYVIVQVITLFIVLISQIARWLCEIEVKNVTRIFENRKKNV